MKANVQKTTVVVSDLCCTSEELRIRKKLEALEGIEELRFNLVAKRVSIDHSASDEKILDALKEIGLPGYVVDKHATVRSKTSRVIIASATISAGLLAAGLVSQLLAAPTVLPSVLFVLSTIIGGRQIVTKAFKAAKALTLEINILMTVAVIGAFALGDYAEGSAVIVLYSISLILESLSVDRTRMAIDSLLRLAPTQVLRLANGSEVSVPVESLNVGDIFRVKPGDRIPLDGEVIQGDSSVDEATLTGESLPVWKSRGASVFAGTLNKNGVMDIRATHRASDSTLAKIIHLVEDAQTEKSPSQQFIERFTRYYTPTVFALAVLIALVPPLIFAQPFSLWLYRSLVLLVIACPCALAISTPVSIVSAIASAARSGVLFNGGRYLETLANVKSVALDKTGTLTLGQAHICQVIPLNSLLPEELIRIAAAMESNSEHHLAEAFLSYHGKSGAAILPSVNNFGAIPGKGVRAEVDGREFFLGNRRLMEDIEIDLARVPSPDGASRTTIFLGTRTQICGAFVVADHAREESQAVIEELHSLGIQPVVMLTGDSIGAAQTIGDALGVDEVRAGLLPAQKLEAVRQLKLKYHGVAMVGDGINDAPALAASDVGIAMGGIGSDTAVHSADVVLMSDSLARLPFALRLSRATLGIIRFNICFALAAKILFIILGAAGISNLWLAILADDGIALLVILNSLRLLKFPDSVSPAISSVSR